MFVLKSSKMKKKAIQIEQHTFPVDSHYRALLFIVVVSISNVCNVLFEKSKLSKRILHSYSYNMERTAHVPLPRAVSLLFEIIRVCGEYPSNIVQCASIFIFSIGEFRLKCSSYPFTPIHLPLHASFYVV